MAPDTGRVNDGGGVRWNLTVDGENESSASSVELALELMEDAVRFHVAEHAEDFVFLHAGNVIFEGLAIILPGRTHAEKSILVRGFVEAGATYLSNDLAVLDEQGRRYSFARRLSQREGPFGPAIRIDMQADEHYRHPHVDVVIETSYSESATWSPERMTSPELLLFLCQHAVAIRERPQLHMEILRITAARASGYKSDRGEWTDVVGWAREHRSHLSSRRQAG